jgi:hypothetical protein
LNYSRVLVFSLSIILILGFIPLIVAGEKAYIDEDVWVYRSKIVVNIMASLPNEQSKKFRHEADKNGDGYVAGWEVEEFKRWFYNKYKNEPIRGNVFLDGRDIELWVTNVGFVILEGTYVSSDTPIYVLVKAKSSDLFISQGTHTVKIKAYGEWVGSIKVIFADRSLNIVETSYGQIGRYKGYPMIEIKSEPNKPAPESVLIVFNAKPIATTLPETTTVTTKTPGFEVVVGLLALIIGTVFKKVW